MLQGCLTTTRKDQRIVLLLHLRYRHRYVALPRASLSRPVGVTIQARCMLFARYVADCHLESTFPSYILNFSDRSWRPGNEQNSTKKKKKNISSDAGSRTPAYPVRAGNPDRWTTTD